MKWIASAMTVGCVLGLAFMTTSAWAAKRTPKSTKTTVAAVKDTNAKTTKKETEIKFEVDKSHSTIGFLSWTPLKLLKVRGKFNEFTGQIAYNPSRGTLTELTGKVQTVSIDTDNAKRDTHLKSDDFLDIKNYPEMTLKNITHNKHHNTLAADLTIKGVTKRVVFKITHLSRTEDKESKREKIQLDANTTINRFDFNIDFTGVLINKSVEISLEISGTLQPVS